MAKKTIPVCDDEPTNLESLRQTIHDLQKKIGEKDLLVEQEKAERSQVEKKLVESQQYLSAIINALSAHIAVLDETGEILQVNTSWRRFADANQLEWEDYGVGRNYLDVTESASGDSTFGAVKAAAGIRDVLTGKCDQFYWEYPCHCPRERRWFIMRVTRFQCNEGIRAVVAHENITQRKESERSLEQSEKSLKKSQEIAHIGSWYLDIKKNELHWSDEVYRIFGLKPQEFGATYEAFLQAVHPDDRDMVNSTYKKAIESKTTYEIVHRILRPNGEVRFVHEKSEDIVDDSGKTVYSTGIVQDITERMRAEEQIKAALREKEVLLKEIHHRVKNNFNIISGLLSLQSRYIKDEQSQQVFKNSRERIETMALIHEKLYKSKNLSKIDFGDYLRSLTSYIFDSYSLQPEQVKLEIEVKKGIYLDIKTSIPISLIINELIANSIKYAFPENRKGEMRINLSDCDEEEYDFTLIVADNGIGFPADMDIRKSDSFGMRIITALIDQLHGDIHLDKTRGTTFTIKFKKPKYSE